MELYKIKTSEDLKKYLTLESTSNSTLIKKIEFKYYLDENETIEELLNQPISKYIDIGFNQTPITLKQYILQLGIFYCILFDLDGETDLNLFLHNH